MAPSPSRLGDVGYGGLSLHGDPSAGGVHGLCSVYAARTVVIFSCPISALGLDGLFLFEAFSS